MHLTYSQALALSDITVPAHLAAQAHVPVLTEPQAQGDILIEPCGDLAAAIAELDIPCHHDDPCDRLVLDTVPRGGVALVGTGVDENAHLLHAGFESVGVRFTDRDSGCSRRSMNRIRGVADHVIAVIDVPVGESAVLIHTDEHGANGIGEGTYLIRRKREFSMWDDDVWVMD